MSKLATFSCTDEKGNVVEVPVYQDKTLRYDGREFTYLSEVADYIGSALSIETVTPYDEDD